MMVQAMKEQNFDIGQTIYAEGSPSGNVYFVVEGKVELTAENEEPWHFEKGAMLGVIDANGKNPHRRTARATTPVRTLYMNFDEYLAALEENFDFTYKMMQMTSRDIFELSLGLPSHEVFAPPSQAKPGWYQRPSLNEIQRLLVLHQAGPFQHAPIQPLVMLARLTHEDRFEAGQEITCPDDQRYICVVADGLVSTRSEEPAVTGHFGAGDIMYGVGCISDVPDTFTSVAVEPTVILHISLEDMIDAAEEHSGMIRSWFNYVGQTNVRARNRMAEILSQDMGKLPVSA